MDFVAIDTSEVHELAAEMRAYVQTMHERGGMVVSKIAHDIAATAQHNLIANDSVDTANLLNSMSVSVRDLDAEIGPTADYGGFVEEGTDGPYPIENAFGWGITVMHPGNAPKPYLGPAFDQHEPNLEKAIGQLGERILR